MFVLESANSVPSGQHSDLVPVRHDAPSPLESTFVVTKPVSHFP